MLTISTVSKNEWQRRSHRHQGDSPPQRREIFENRARCSRRSRETVGHSGRVHIQSLMPEGRYTIHPIGYDSRIHIHWV